MANGIRVTQEGVPVQRAAEYQEILDERFPFLEFSFVGEVRASGSIPASGTVAVELHRHGLPHVPGFFWMPIKPDGTYEDDFNVPDPVSTSDRVVIEFASYMGSSYSVRGVLMVVKNDLTQTIKAPRGGSVVQSTTGPQKRGIAVLREGGGDIESNDKTNFTLHTNARSFAIHMCGVENVPVGDADGGFYITHDLGYPPTFFYARRFVETFDALKGQTCQEPFMYNAGLARATATTLFLRGGQGALQGDYMYLILKDPVDTAI